MRRARSSSRSSIALPTSAPGSNTASPAALTSNSHPQHTTTPASVPASHRRIRSSLRRPPRYPTASSRSPFPSHDSPSTPSTAPLTPFPSPSLTPSPLGFTATLTLRRLLMKARIITNLTRSPILNPPHILPRSSPPVTLRPPPSSPSPFALAPHPIPLPTFLPHLSLLAAHPSLTLLTYPPASYLSHQSSPTSLIHLLTSGRVRLIRDGVVCAEVGRGGAVGVEEAVRGSEGYRRWRRRQRRRRQRRVREGAVVGEVDAEAEADERELGLDVEEATGRKRRRVRVTHYCTVQCMEVVQCVVFPASVLLAYLDSDRALRLHSLKWVMAVHCMRRGQWKEAERRIRCLWGGPQPLSAKPADEDDPLSPACRVRGSAGFVRYGLVGVGQAREEALRQWVDVEHGMFAHAAGEGGGPVERRRVKVKASGARGGDRAQKAEMKRVKDTMDKARKVRGIIDAMERKRREKAKAEKSRQRGGEGDDSMDDDDSEDDDDDENDDGEYDEEEEDGEGDPLQDERYAAAITQRLSVVMAGTVGKIKGKGPSHARARRATQGDRDRGAAKRRMSVTRPVQDTRVEAVMKPAWEVQEEGMEEELSTRMMRSRSVDKREERAAELQRERPRTASAFIDCSFVRPGTPSTAQLQRQSTGLLLSRWQELDRRQQSQGQSAGRRGKEERRLMEEQEDKTKLVDDDDAQVLVEPSLGVEALQLTDYGRTRGRLQGEEEEAKEAEVEAARVTARLTVNELGVRQVEDRRWGGAARSAVRSMTEVEVLAMDAEQRFGRDERQLHRLLLWTSEQVQQERQTPTPTATTATPAPLSATAAAPPGRPHPHSRPMLRKGRTTKDVMPKVVQVEEEAKVLFVTVEEPSADVQLDGGDESIALSPPSIASSPFHLLFPSHLTKPASSTVPRAQTARSPSAAQPRSSTPTTPRTARPSTASSMRTSLLHRQRRTAAVLDQSVQSLVEGAGRQELSWQVRLRLLQEADALDVEREATQQRLSSAPLAAAPTRESVAAILSGAERVRRVKVVMEGVAAAVVCETSPGMGTQRPLAARPSTSDAMWKYRSRMLRSIVG